MLNQFLNGRYKIIQALGEGGLAQTYIAEDHHQPSHPQCAVKFLKPASKEADFLPIARRLFNKEAEILEKLGEHPQIPRLLAYFEENKEFYLIQEFIEGYTLSTELPLGHRWSESQVILMLQDVSQILEFVHSYGVIHRDIKPNNLIRRHKDNRLVLIDFGAVKEVSNLRIMSNVPTSKKTIAIGTQGYMPTEQVRGKPRLNSDIYALGMVGIQALTGVDPIYLEEDTEGEVIWQNRAKVSDLLADILTKMVRYHFKDRYQSATEVLEALQPLTNEQKYTQPVFVTQQVNSKLSSDVEYKETKVALDREKSQSEAASADYQETKVALKPESPISSVNSQPKYQETKVDRKNNAWISWNNKVANKESTRKKIPDKKQPSSELQETRISLATEKLKEKVVTPSLQQETKIAIDSQEHQKGTLEIASNPLKKINLNYLSTFSTVFKNLDFSFTPTFFTLKKSRLLPLAGTLSIFLGLLASYYYFNHRKAYLQAQEKLQQIEELKVAEKYSECIQQAKIFPQDYTDLNNKLNTLLLDCREGEATAKLAEAKKLAAQSKFKDAIAVLARIPQDLAVYAEAQPLITQWSDKIWQIAKNKYQEGKLEEAKAIANSLPDNSSLNTKVQTTIKKWEEEWKQNQTHLETAQKAIKESRWQDAVNAAKKISDHPYWQKQSQPIMQKAETEIREFEAASKKTYNNSRSNTYRSQKPARSYRQIPRFLPLLPLPNQNSSKDERPSDWICLNNPNPKCKK